MRIPHKALLRTLLAFAFTSATIGAVPAHALTDDYVFAFTGPSGGKAIVLNGNATIEATTLGKVDNTGANNGGVGQNFQAGDCSSCGNVNYRNYMSFDLSNTTGQITSATLSLVNPVDGFAGIPNNFVVHDISTWLSVLTTSGLPLYNAIGAAPVIGTAHVDTSNNSNTVDVILNSIGIALLNSSEGHSVAFGGTFGGAAAVSSVPLPAGLPMFGLAMLAMFAAVQFNKRFKIA